jgi:hypothetical protein
MELSLLCRLHPVNPKHAGDAGGVFRGAPSSRESRDLELRRGNEPRQLRARLLSFAPVVYYPIWLVGNKQADTVFSYHPAFLNGNFWQSVVAAVKKFEVP